MQTVTCIHQLCSLIFGQTVSTKDSIVSFRKMKHHMSRLTKMEDVVEWLSRIESQVYVHSTIISIIKGFLSAILLLQNYQHTAASMV